MYTYVHLSMKTVFADLKASIVFSVGEYWQFKQHFLFSNFHLWEAKIYKWSKLTWNHSAIAPGNGVVGIEFGTIFEAE